jgi:hypothetical protein
MQNIEISRESLQTLISWNTTRGVVLSADNEPESPCKRILLHDG